MSQLKSCKTTKNSSSLRGLLGHGDGNSRLLGTITFTYPNFDVYVMDFFIVGTSLDITFLCIYFPILVLEIHHLYTEQEQFCR